jgi:hypothetical protein
MTPNAQDLEQEAGLAEGYSASHRLYECVGIFLGTTTMGLLALRLAATDNISGWWVPLCVFVGVVVADFGSGMVHWACDTWGSVRTPVLGRLAIRTFREHHVDAMAITRHDFIETNGHNVALSTIHAVSGILVLQRGTFVSTLLAMTYLSAALFTAMTSQIHKWAHTPERPQVVRWLQEARLILQPDHHEEHHRTPHDRNYCITVGWLNRPLAAIAFFESLERLITAVTGCRPRASDPLE